jgi:hypothetical protein
MIKNDGDLLTNEVPSEKLMNEKNGVYHSIMQET